ncbi:MAG: Mut7-C RNAse domain-containing protein [Chloroflexota bacterium]|nr:Mut7-C RNAse domain-containing protein [Chloroflexota bacterium]
MCPKFIADCNVGKLARLLRMMGYDTLFFRHIEDCDLVDIALEEHRIILTRDTQIALRRVVVSGQLKAILLDSDDHKEQLHQLLKLMGLKCDKTPFTRCLECNDSLVPKSKDEVSHLVPLYVLHTQTNYMQCPSCDRVYWRGTHWRNMIEDLQKITTDRLD